MPTKPGYHSQYNIAKEPESPMVVVVMAVYRSYYLS